MKAAGGVLPVLNARHETAKAGGWVEAPPSEKEFVAAVLAEPNLLRRPIVMKDGRIVVGKDAAGWKGLA